MRKKNQRVIHDIYSNKSGSFNIKTRRLFNHAKFHFGGLIKGGLTVLISVLMIYGVVQATTVKITPPTGTPTANFYSLSEIYNLITSNTAATEGSPALDWSIALEDTQYSLTEIYEALRDLISAEHVKLGTTYLGVAGTLTSSASTTAVVADVFNGKKAHLTADWTVDTGTLNLACNISTFDGTDNLVATAYDGDGDGTNRWCITDTGDAVASDILAGKIAWVDGIAVTGDIVTQTLSSANDTVSAGYYAATTLAAVDTDLVSASIKSGINIFGVAGDSNVVDTSSGDAIAGDVADGKICFVDGSQVTGSMFANQKNQTIDDWLDGAGTTAEYTGEEATWTTATTTFTGNTSIDYTDTAADNVLRDLVSNTVQIDGRTGLWWTDAMSVDDSATATTTDNIFTLSADGSRPTGGNALGFCAALNSYNAGAGYGGYTDWYLPTQKELMQAYIDGSANNLLNAGASFWSSTEYYVNSASAWRVVLYYGDANVSAKTGRYYVRCVRRP